MRGRVTADVGCFRVVIHGGWILLTLSVRLPSDKLDRAAVSAAGGKADTTMRDRVMSSRTMVVSPCGSSDSDEYREKMARRNTAGPTDTTLNREGAGVASVCDYSSHYRRHAPATNQQPRHTDQRGRLASLSNASAERLRCGDAGSGWTCTSLKPALSRMMTELA